MSTLSDPELNAQLVRIAGWKEEIERRLIGFQQMLDEYTLTDEERTNIQKLMEQYNLRITALDESRRTTTRLITLNFPNFPSIAVLQSMLDSLDREAEREKLEQAKADEVRRLFLLKEQPRPPMAKNIEFSVSEVRNQID